jgi:multidrug efflux pump subunit AcrA (membrane-fusion protein)
MKTKTLIISGIVGLIVFLIYFSRSNSRRESNEIFAEVKQGVFEITVSATGELIAENSIEIKGPDFANRRDLRSSNITIQDLVAEGTIVNKGDYVATLDRTNFDNTLKDERERLTSLYTNLEMKLMDSAIVINDALNDITNRKYIVEESEMTLRNSKYEPASVLRQAEINLDQAQRVLEQRERTYTLRVAQINRDIYNLKWFIGRVEKRIRDLEEVLEDFTITAPSSGMITYLRERRGTKRKVGSVISPFDRVIATLPDLSSMLSKVYISEIEINRIKPGQMTQIKIDAYPDKMYTGSVLSIANIGEQLPNTDSKVFEVQIKIDGSDPRLRPSMTSSNKLIINSFDDAIYVPAECVHAGLDSIPYVYTKNGTRQIVVLGETSEKNIIIEKGLEPGMSVYLIQPEKPYKFELSGEELIPLIKNGGKQEDDKLARLRE